MNLLVINVALRPESPVKHFPIGIAYIVTALNKAGYEFDFVDVEAQRYNDKEMIKIIENKNYDIILLGCIVTGYSIIKKISSTIKSIHPASIIVVGNSVATSIPDILLTRTDCDVAVMGEGDITVIQLLRTLESGNDLSSVPGISYLHMGKTITTREQPLIDNIDDLPFINYDLFDVFNYIKASQYIVSDPLPFKREETRALAVNTARGCIWNCTFCYHVFLGKKYRYRSVSSLVSEITQLVSKYNINYVYFSDELTFFSKERCREFVNELNKSKITIYWYGACRADLFNSDSDLDLIFAMKDSGCLGLGFSLESSSTEILIAMKKKISVTQFSKQTKLLQRGGLNVYTSLVFGFPQETTETIKNTIQVCIDNGVWPSAGYLLPQPGSIMYDYALKKGFITDVENYLMAMGDRQDLRLNMTEMSDHVFEQTVNEEMARCNRELKMGITGENYMKTTYYRAKK